MITKTFQVKTSELHKWLKRVKIAMGRIVDGTPKYNRVVRLTTSENGTQLIITGTGPSWYRARVVMNVWGVSDGVDVTVDIIALLDVVAAAAKSEKDGIIRFDADSHLDYSAYGTYGRLPLYKDGEFISLTEKDMPGNGLWLSSEAATVLVDGISLATVDGGGSRYDALRNVLVITKDANTAQFVAMDGFRLYVADNMPVAGNTEPQVYNVPADALRVFRRLMPKRIPDGGMSISRRIVADNPIIQLEFSENDGRMTVNCAPHDGRFPDWEYVLSNSYDSEHYSFNTYDMFPDILRPVVKSGRVEMVIEPGDELDMGRVEFWHKQNGEDVSRVYRLSDIMSSPGNHDDDQSLVLNPAMMADALRAVMLADAYHRTGVHWRVPKGDPSTNCKPIILSCGDIVCITAPMRRQS